MTAESNSQKQDIQIKILEGLNENQSNAVQSITGSTLVIAGAGSGKTAVLARRVAYLVSEFNEPGKILCLTFTNKAAAEMNHRVKKILTESGINLPSIPPWEIDYVQQPTICTFHSLGNRLLREFGDKIDLKKEFNILDSEDQKKIIRGIFKDLNIDIKKINPSNASYFISQCKQEMLTPDKSHQITKDFLPVFHQIYKLYSKTLKENHTVDFDDLILLPYLILRDNKEVLDIIQDRWWHIMVDEFQDTNPSQFELIKLISPPDLV
jgi:DNA helicase II / ATP-dependent DNA helicase PcrA